MEVKQDIKQWIKPCNIKQYFKENRWWFLLGAAALILIYFTQFDTSKIRIDTEILVNHPQSSFNWLEIGRQGGVFTRLLLEGLNYNPYYNFVLSMVIYLLAMGAFAYLFHCVGNVKGAVSVVFYLVF